MLVVGNKRSVSKFVDILIVLLPDVKIGGLWTASDSRWSWSSDCGLKVGDVEQTSVSEVIVILPDQNYKDVAAYQPRDVSCSSSFEPSDNLCLTHWSHWTAMESVLKQNTGFTSDNSYSSRNNVKDMTLLRNLGQIRSNFTSAYASTNTQRSESGDQSSLRSVLRWCMPIVISSKCSDIWNWAEFLNFAL